jgi:molybdopterin converting factor small subunit
MAKIRLTPAVREEVRQGLADLEELDDSLDALEELGQLLPGQREAHEEGKRRAKLLLERF